MGFKNSGFPDFRFNPLGFRTTGPLRYLIRNCGLESYSKGVTDGVLIDKVGKTGTESSREAVQGRTILGDGSTYLDTTIVPNQNTILRVWGNFNSLTGGQRFGTRVSTTSNMYFFGISATIEWQFGWENVGAFAVAADTDFHKFEINGGKFLIDDAVVYDFSSTPLTSIITTLDILGLNQNGSHVNQCDFDLDKAEIVHNGITYTLDINPDNNEYALIPDDNSPQIDVQQFLAPATPTEINITNEDIRDLYGYTVATGVETRDSAGLSPYTVGYKIPNYYNGLSVGYLSGEHFRGTYTGRVKYNFSLVGDVLKLDDLYNGIFIADVTGILHTAGVLNELSWSGIPNIKLGEGGNPQMIANKDEESVAFYENGLPEGSDCLYRALKLQKLNEGYQVQTTESSGEYETYNVTEGPYFVIKEGVTIG